MERLLVYLPTDLKARLEREVQRRKASGERKINMSAIVIELLEQELPQWSTGTR